MVRHSPGPVAQRGMAPQPGQKMPGVPAMGALRERRIPQPENASHNPPRHKNRFMGPDLTGADEQPDLREGNWGGS